MPRNLNDSTAVTVLFMMVSGGRAGGFLLKSTIISTVLSVLSSRLLRLLEYYKKNVFLMSYLMLKCYTACLFFIEICFKVSPTLFSIHCIFQSWQNKLKNNI